jgi:hypothetical protein
MSGHQGVAGDGPAWRACLMPLDSPFLVRSQGTSWSVKRVGIDRDDSSPDYSSVSGSDALEDAGWVKRDIARAKEAVRARSHSRLSGGSSVGKGGYEFMVSVTEDSGVASASGSSSGPSPAAKDTYM